MQSTEETSDTIFQLLPSQYRDMFGAVVYAEWGCGWLPCLVVNPFRLPSGHDARKLWTKKFNKVCTYELYTYIAFLSCRRGLIHTCTSCLQQLSAKSRMDSYLVYWYGEKREERYSLVSGSGLRVVQCWEDEDVSPGAFAEMEKDLALPILERRTEDFTIECRCSLKDLNAMDFTEMFQKVAERHQHEPMDVDHEEGTSDGLEEQLIVPTLADDPVIAIWQCMDPDGGPREPKTFRRSDANSIDTASGRRYKEFDMGKFKVGEGAGKVRIYPNFVDNKICSVITKQLISTHERAKKEEDKVFRQYPSRSGQGERRVHGLLDCGSGEPLVYKYHSTRVVSTNSVASIPGLKDVGDQAAKAAGIGDSVEEFGTGCHVNLFRNGNDHIPKHADDTQGEKCIFTIITLADPVRPLILEPKGAGGKGKQKREYRTGDFVLTLLPAVGDAYYMDAKVQEDFLHSVPKVVNSTLSGRRCSLVFRQGCRKTALPGQQLDNGKVPTNLDGDPTLTDEQRYPFGPMLDVLEYGNVYSRKELLELKAFSNMHGGISGNQERGCDAIVVAKQRHGDDFNQLTYSASSNQRGKAMYRTYTAGHNLIRVFRSTSLPSCYRALSKEKTQMYRYDGLYKIVDCSTTEVAKHTQKPTRRARKPTYHYTVKLCRVDRGNLHDSSTHLENCRRKGTLARKGALEMEAWQSTTR